MRGALAGPKVFPQMKGFICCSWGVFNGVEGKGKAAAIKEPAVKELFEQLAGGEFKGFVDPDQPGVMKGSNASLVVLDPKGKAVHVFNEWGAYERDFKVAWERLGMSPGQFPAKTSLTFPGVRDTDSSTGPGAGPAGADYSFLAKDARRAFRLFLQTGPAKVVVEARPVSLAQAEALAWSSEPRQIEAALFKSLLDTINPGGVARAMDVVIPWKEIRGSLKWEPAGADGRYRFAVIRGPVEMTKKEGTFRADGTIQAVACYLADRPELHAIRGAINVSYVGGGTATPDRPAQFSIAWVMTPEPEDIPAAFRIPLQKDK